MVAHHHERHDGSGYPNGLSGDRILVMPALRRLSIVTMPLPAIAAMPAQSWPSAAIKMLCTNGVTSSSRRSWSKSLSRLSAYTPPGTLVNYPQVKWRRWSQNIAPVGSGPKVMVLLDANKLPVRK